LPPAGGQAFGLPDDSACVPDRRLLDPQGGIYKSAPFQQILPSPHPSEIPRKPIQPKVLDERCENHRHFRYRPITTTIRHPPQTVDQCPSSQREHNKGKKVLAMFSALF